MTTENTMESNNRGLYNDNSLSDIIVKFNGQNVFAHKAILAHKCIYFRKAFTGSFPVATSEDVDLGDDDDAEAVHAMIRHIYDMSYAQEETHTSNERLVFCMNVFIVGDKYDVPSLRKKIVPDFLELLQQTCETTEFVDCVHKLCGPDAMKLADPALQLAIADFFTNNMTKLKRHDSLVKMIKQDQSFTGRILAGLLESKSGSIRYLSVCHKPNSSQRTPPDCMRRTEGQTGYLGALNVYCVHCGTSGGEAYNMSGGGTAVTKITPKVKVVFM